MRDKWNRWRSEFGAETDYIIKLWSCFSDPEQQKSFLETIRERKKASSRYSIYDDYPIAKTATDRARNECVSFVKGLMRPVIKEEESDVGE